MMKNNDENYWVVVLVESGIPVSADIFPSCDQALAFEEKLRSQIRSDNDEIGIFESSLA